MAGVCVWSSRGARQQTRRRSARLLTNGLCRRDKRRAKAVRPRISGPRATLRPARSDLASWKNLVLWAFLGVLTGCVNRLTLSVKAYLGRQEQRASETSLNASPFWNMIPDA